MSERPTTWEQAAREASNILKGYSGPWKIETSESYLHVMGMEMDDLIDTYYHDNTGTKLFPASVECHLGTMADCALRMLGLRSGVNPAVWMDKVVLLVAKKQHDYGHKNITRFGLKGLIVRLHDKYARLSNLLERDFAPEVEESVEDTLLDVVGYGLIGVMLDRNTFTLELSGELFTKKEEPKAERTDIAAAVSALYGYDIDIPYYSEIAQ